MKRIGDMYKRNFMAFELGFAFLLATTFGLIVHFYLGNAQLVSFLKGNRQAVYASLASLTGSLLGFVIAAVPIILGFLQTPKLKIVRDSSHYAEIFRIFFQAIYWLAASALCSLMGIFLDTDNRPQELVVYVTLFLFAAAVARVSRCVWILKQITWLATRRPTHPSAPTLP